LKHRTTPAGRVQMSALPTNIVVGGRYIAYEFPAKKSAGPSKRLRIDVVKFDDVFRIESNDKSSPLRRSVTDP
jgi:hypothetical protein